MKLEDGSPDQIEFYSISQDDILGTSAAYNHPPLLKTNRPLLNDFIPHAYGVCSHLLSHLDKHLTLAPGTLSSLSPVDKPSGTSLRLLKCHPSPTGSFQSKLVGHTDLGSLTMLFNIVGGLQVLPPGSENLAENWRYIRPRPACALINLGDAMVQWTGGIMKSAMHRVATPPGDQAGCTRYSVAYLVKPAGEVSMKRLEGGFGSVIPRAEKADSEMCATEWEKMRAAQIMEGENKPESLGDRKV